MTIDHSYGGQWTRDKLEIHLRYLDAYTTALKNRPFRLSYIDAFAGPGSWQPGAPYESTDYGEFNDMLKGSPKIALDIIDKPFDKCVFIDTKKEHIESLKAIKDENPKRNINIINMDANKALPRICHDLDEFERAVVFLDPYATEVSWATIVSIARTEKVDCWILFPLMAIARQMPLEQEPAPTLMCNLDRIFGGRKFWHDFYSPVKQHSFWGQGDEKERESGSDKIAEAYRERLKTEFVSVAPTRRGLKNSRNSNLFDLFFAASNPKGARRAVEIADYILKHW